MSIVKPPAERNVHARPFPAMRSKCAAGTTFPITRPGTAVYCRYTCLTPRSLMRAATSRRAPSRPFAPRASPSVLTLMRADPTPDAALSMARPRGSADFCRTSRPASPAGAGAVAHRAPASRPVASDRQDSAARTRSAPALVARRRLSGARVRRRRSCALTAVTASTSKTTAESSATGMTAASKAASIALFRGAIGSTYTVLPPRLRDSCRLNHRFGGHLRPCTLSTNLRVQKHVPRGSELQTPASRANHARSRGRSRPAGLRPRRRLRSPTRAVRS